MKTSLLVLWLASTAALMSATPAAAGNLVVENPTGDMRIQLSIPVVEDVDQRVAITGGSINVGPGEGVPVEGGRQFRMMEAKLSFADFTIERPFVTKHGKTVGVHLVGVVPFVAAEQAPGVYTFSIPAEDVLLFGGMIMDGDVHSGLDLPREPVTGTLDLNAGTFTARIVLDRGGKVSILGVDHDMTGSLTVVVSGPLGPDADGDGVRDSRDNCRLVANADQAPVASPTVVAPEDVAFSSCAGGPIGTASAVDVCDAGPVTVTHDAPATFPVGTTTVTWTARSASGHETRATQRVTVADTTLPRFLSVPPEVTVGACGPVDIGLPTAIDDCGFGPPQVTSDAPATYPPGPTLVTWTATDGSGNRTTATQLVTVNDSTPPTFTSVPPAVLLTQCVGADIGHALATDACGVTVTNNAPAKLPLAQTTLVTWVARDGAGNIATALQEITTELADDASCCPQGTLVKVGTAGRDVFLGTSASECILGRGGDDVIDGRDGVDFISGGEGRDVINGGFGGDLIYGRGGDDVIDGGPGADRIDGGPGTDTCAGGTDRNTIVGCEIKSGD